MGQKSPGAAKRQKELARAAKRREKEAKRAQRRKEREDRMGAWQGDEDPDLAGIVPGPVPVDPATESSG